MSRATGQNPEVWKLLAALLGVDDIKGMGIKNAYISIRVGEPVEITLERYTDSENIARAIPVVENWTVYPPERTAIGDTVKSYLDA